MIFHIKEEGKMKSDLLAQIQAGKKLKKVSAETAKEKANDKSVTVKEAKRRMEGTKMSPKKLEVLSQEAYTAQIEGVYASCENNTRPLEMLNNSLAEDLLFIVDTELNLKSKGKLTADKTKELNELRDNITARKALIAHKIHQFRVENREIIEANQMRESLVKKLTELSLQDLTTIKEMLETGKPISTMVKVERREVVDTSGSAALLDALRGFNRSTLRKTPVNEKPEETTVTEAPKTKDKVNEKPVETTVT
jgi:hypothetical protein